MGLPYCTSSLRPPPSKADCRAGAARRRGPTARRDGPQSAPVHLRCWAARPAAAQARRQERPAASPWPCGAAPPGSATGPRRSARQPAPDRAHRLSRRGCAGRCVCLGGSGSGADRQRTPVPVRLEREQPARSRGGGRDLRRERADDRERRRHRRQQPDLLQRERDDRHRVAAHRRLLPVAATTTLPSRWCLARCWRRLCRRRRRRGRQNLLSRMIPLQKAPYVPRPRMLYSHTKPTRAAQPVRGSRVITYNAVPLL